MTNKVYVHVSMYVVNVEIRVYTWGGFFLRWCLLPICLTIHCSPGAFLEAAICTKRELLNSANAAKKISVPYQKAQMLTYQMQGKETVINWILFSLCQFHVRRHLNSTQLEFGSSPLNKTP